MKLFHTENGKETVYVQMEDMMRLNQSSIPIPVSIFEKVFTPCYNLRKQFKSVQLCKI